MTAYIAKPLGLSKAGTSGLGGSPEPLLKIRRCDFQRLGGILYALRWNVGSDAPTQDTCLIDIVYDGHTEQDPHSSRPLIYVTNYAVKQSPWWLGQFAAPNGMSKFSAIGTHKVKISVAPRKAPAAGTGSANETLPARDFSEAAGGITKEFTFEIVPDNTPYDLPPEQAAQDA